MLEELIKAANEMFAKFWLIVLALLPFILLYGFIKRLFFE
jgi:hypothetical protein